MGLLSLKILQFFKKSITEKISICYKGKYKLHANEMVLRRCELLSPEGLLAARGRLEKHVLAPFFCELTFPVISKSRYCTDKTKIHRMPMFRGFILIRSGSGTLDPRREFTKFLKYVRTVFVIQFFGTQIVRFIQLCTYVSS